MKLVVAPSKTSLFLKFWVIITGPKKMEMATTIVKCRRAGDKFFMVTSNCLRSVANSDMR